ncbi:hypothetical protein LXL04_011044 [Taraxacum kok-saghyz]
MFPGVMMLTGATTFNRRTSPARTACLASRTDTDQLRDQLDQLQYEASNIRAKANKARQRLLRLSEAAQKLQRQAAISVQTGKENDARDLLYQKKQTMEALEKTKSRIELLDELSNKLIEAISIREQQLVVGTVSQDLETEREDDTATVRVMSPPSESSNGISESDLINCNNDDQELKDKTAKLEANNLKEYLTSYEDFLDLIDQQLNKIETELMTAVKFSSLVLESKESPENVKVQQLVEILDAVCEIRERIANIVQRKTDILS